MRSGVVFSILAAGLLLGCGRGARGGAEAGGTVELDSGVVTLPAGARVHDVRLSGGDGRERIDPASVRARPGDAVRFVAGDALTHAVAFDTAAMPAVARAFLARTNQVSGPPLIERGATWVVALDGAPPGDYPFQCLAHGGAGRLTVAAPER